MGGAPLLAKHLPASARQPEQKRANPKSYGVRRVGREAVNLRVGNLDDRFVPIRDEDPRRILRMLQTAKRLSQVISREVERLNFTAADIAVTQCSFHSSQSNEGGSKCLKGFGICGAGNLAFGAKLF